MCVCVCLREHNSNLPAHLHFSPQCQKQYATYIIYGTKTRTHAQTPSQSGELMNHVSGPALPGIWCINEAEGKACSPHEYFQSVFASGSHIHAKMSCKWRPDLFQVTSGRGVCIQPQTDDKLCTFPNWWSFQRTINWKTFALLFFCTHLVESCRYSK